MFRKRGFVGGFAFLATCFIVAVWSWGWHGSDAAAQNAVLSNSDCVKCHPQQNATIEGKGAKHKTAIGCLDCHVEHPPAGTNAIPACSMCHSGKPHYDLPQCATCHSDPHDPLGIKLGEKNTPVCLTCHPPQGQELKTAPSKHTQLDCSYCHPVHRQFLNCLKCHEPHTKDMTYQTCRSCHAPHKPLEVKYTMDTPSESCAACHGDAYDNLKANKTKHHNLSCAYCHRDKHKVVPPCEACHGKPHAPAMHEKKPTCGGCHETAHTLVK